MENAKRVVLLATWTAGLLVALVLGLTAVDVSMCYRSVADHGGLGLCDLSWLIAGALCIVIGLVWLVIVAIAAGVSRCPSDSKDEEPAKTVRPAPVQNRPAMTSSSVSGYSMPPCWTS